MFRNASLVPKPALIQLMKNWEEDQDLGAAPEAGSELSTCTERERGARAREVEDVDAGRDATEAGTGTRRRIRAHVGPRPLHLRARGGEKAACGAIDLWWCDRCSS